MLLATRSVGIPPGQIDTRQHHESRQQRLAWRSGPRTSNRNAAGNTHRHIESAPMIGMMSAGVTCGAPRLGSSQLSWIKPRDFGIVLNRRISIAGAWVCGDRRVWRADPLSGAQPVWDPRVST
jgi:hypothetical protein